MYQYGLYHSVTFDRCGQLFQFFIPEMFARIVRIGVDQFQRDVVAGRMGRFVRRKCRVRVHRIGFVSVRCGVDDFVFHKALFLKVNN